MNENQQNQIQGRWVERLFSKAVITPFQNFVGKQMSSSLLLLGAAILALWMANSIYMEFYHHMGHTKLSLSLGSYTLDKTIHHWVNDGLMTLFFFLVGLELKREFLVGELARPKQAALPIFAAIGGMIVPAIIYWIFNHSGPASRGWGIVMATDIAFALGAIALLAGRVPNSLIAFLVALAIVDDLGAVLVIAIFYTSDLNMTYLMYAGFATLGLIFINFLGVHKTLPYFLVGIILWFFMLKSGVHATLAGVIAAFCVPAKPKYNPFDYAQEVREQLQDFRESHSHNQDIMQNSEMRGIIRSIEKKAQGVQTPLQRLETSLHFPVGFLILPLFAFLNAGITIDLSHIGTELTKTVTYSVILGLLVGKAIGVSLFSWAAIRLGVADLPAGSNFKQIIGAAILAGIGFTMSIFVTELAFTNHPELAVQAKLGILVASTLAGIIGCTMLFMVSPKAKQDGQ